MSFGHGGCFLKHHHLFLPLQVFGFHEHGSLAVSKPTARKPPNVCRMELPDLRARWNLEDFNDWRYQAPSYAARRPIGLAMGGVLLVAPAGIEANLHEASPLGVRRSLRGDPSAVW